MSDRRPCSVLQVGYYQTLLHTRQLMLEQDGYEVVSALGNEEAKLLARSKHFDLIVVGFSAPLSDRRAIVQWLKQNVERTPVLVLQAHSSERCPEADLETLSEDPKVWLEAVRQAVAR